jgi:hypothetical protein
MVIDGAAQELLEETTTDVGPADPQPGIKLSTQLTAQEVVLILSNLFIDTKKYAKNMEERTGAGGQHGIMMPFRVSTDPWGAEMTKSISSRH